MALHVENTTCACGTLQACVEIDKFKNQVSLLTFSDARTYRMIHHPTRSPCRGYATIYAGQDVLLRVRSFCPNSDIQETTLEIGGYEFAWGDGEMMDDVIVPAGKPDLRERLRPIYRDGENFEQLILEVVNALREDLKLWDTKASDRARCDERQAENLRVRQRLDEAARADRLPAGWGSKP